MEGSDNWCGCLLALSALRAPMCGDLAFQKHARAHTHTQHTHTHTHMFKNENQATGMPTSDGPDALATPLAHTTTSVSDNEVIVKGKAGRAPGLMEELSDGGGAAAKEPGLSMLTPEQLMLVHELGGIDGEEGAGLELPEGRPSRHLWLGNIPLKPNKSAMELLFRWGSGRRVRGGVEWLCVYVCMCV
eukprot:1159892-Pelagomonas_calceolata.AAC.6